MELTPGGAAPPGPVGMLTVRLVRIQGLRSDDLLGHSDPYVVVQVGAGLDCLLLGVIMCWGCGVF